MKLAEIKENVQNHTPGIIKCARLFTGLDQIEFSQAIGISQSLVSKYEKGNLLPDTITWALICNITKIPLDSNIVGFIDMGERATPKFRLEKENKYLNRFVNKDFRKNCYFNNRFFMPLIHNLSKKLSKKDLEKFFKEIKVDPSYFYRLDLQLNERFFEKIYKYFSKNKDILRTISQSWESSYHGNLYHKFEPHISSPVERMRIFSNLSSKYNCFFSYKIKDSSSNKIELEVEPKFDLKNDFLADYNNAYLQSISGVKKANLFSVNKKSSSWQIQVTQ